MRLVAFILLLCTVGCGAPAQEAPDPTTPLDPIISTELPEKIPDVAPGKRVVEAVKTCEVEVVEGSEWRAVGPGVFMSYEMAKRAALLRVGYDEMRGNYEVDIRTANRAQGAYQKQLDRADAEVARLRKAARRSWWEKHGPQVALGVGVVVGVGVAVGILAAMNGVTSATE